MCRGRATSPIKAPEKESLNEIDVNDSDHFEIPYRSRLSDYLYSSNRITTTEYFVRNGENWLRQIIVPVFADQTPRNQIRPWPIVREILLWHPDSIFTISDTDSESESGSFYEILVRIDEADIITISSTDSDIDTE